MEAVGAGVEIERNNSGTKIAKLLHEVSREPYLFDSKEVVSSIVVPGQVEQVQRTVKVSCGCFSFFRHQAVY